LGSSYGSQEAWFREAVWGFSEAQISNGGRRIPSPQHDEPLRQAEWLQDFLQDRPPERVLADPTKARGRTENAVITPFGFFVFLRMPFGLCIHVSTVPYFSETNFHSNVVLIDFTVTIHLLLGIRDWRVLGTRKSSPSYPKVSIVDKVSVT
jgi:hypothetical protein